MFKAVPHKKDFKFMGPNGVPEKRAKIIFEKKSVFAHFTSNLFKNK